MKVIFGDLDEMLSELREKEISDVRIEALYDERYSKQGIPSGIYHVLEGGEPEMVIHALAEGESLMLIGDTGVGKSKLIQFLAQETNTPLMAPCSHAEVTVESLLGCMIAVNGSTVWQDGVLPEAMRKGHWLMIEEINALDPGIAKALNEVLDSRSVTIIIAGKPRVVKASDAFRLICATDPPDNPIYKGIEAMSFELMDRFDAVVWLDYLSPEKEAEVVAERSGYKDMAKMKKMVEIANDVREGMCKAEIDLMGVGVHTHLMGDYYDIFTGITDMDDFARQLLELLRIALQR